MKVDPVPPEAGDSPGLDRMAQSDNPEVDIYGTSES